MQSDTRQRSSCRRSRRILGGLKAPGGADRGPEIEALVFRLLDQHHGLERIDVVDALLLALRRDLGLVGPVVELHLRDPRDLTDLAQVELDLPEVLGQIDRLEEIDLSARGHRCPFCDGLPRSPLVRRYTALIPHREGRTQKSRSFGGAAATALWRRCAFATTAGPSPPACRRPIRQLERGSKRARPPEAA